MRRQLDVACAVVVGVVSHGAFVLAVAGMAWSLAAGLQVGCGNLVRPWAHLANILLAAQFPLLHSWLLTASGRRLLARLAPGGRGRTLSPSSYAAVASLQLIAVFGLWTPSGVVWWQPQGTTQIVAAWTPFVASWLFLVRALSDGNLALQTGAVGWWALLRGRRPDFGGMPTRGLFRHCRQPIYLGFLMVLWTAPTRTPDQLMLALLWTPYCFLGPLLKEQRFLARFGAEFAGYRARVPYFVPRLHREGRDEGT